MASAACWSRAPGTSWRRSTSATPLTRSAGQGWGIDNYRHIQSEENGRWHDWHFVSCIEDIQREGIAHNLYINLCPDTTSVTTSMDACQQYPTPTRCEERDDSWRLQQSGDADNE
eukprot:6214268-Pleurochrysis_carterae.AAC.1